MPTKPFKLRDLRVHPAQMRTTLEPAAMVDLTQQMLERGLDAHQPILAAPDGVVVSGHRRWLALLLAHAVRAQAGPATPERADIERVVSETAAQAGDLARAYEPLTEQYGDHAVEVAVFEGDPAAQVLALQAANFGQAPADALGLAHSFQEAVRLGVAPARLAANIGKPPAFVESHLALATLPAELAQLIAAGRLAMGVAVPLAALPDAKREALARVIAARAQTSNAPTVPLVRDAAQRLVRFQGFTTPLTSDAVERNRARALAALWEHTLRETAHRAWVIAADAAYQAVLDDPANQPDHAAALVYAFDRRYVVGGRVDWAGVLRTHVPEMTCEGCVVGSLPAAPLGEDLPLSCRRGEGHPGVCIRWLGARDPVHMEVPWSWQGLPGVSADPPYRVTSQADLERAWHARREAEQAEAAQSACECSPDGRSAEVASVESDDAVGTATDSAPVVQADSDKTPVADAAAGDVVGSGSATIASSTNGGAARPSAIEAMRSAIRRYMGRHEALSGAQHPLATRCDACRHRLDRSPTRDEAVPPCAWAARQHAVEFRQRVPVDGQAPVIPWCLQYAPGESDWSKIIPDADGAPGTPRAWLVHHIRFLDAQLARGGGGATLEPLTGRPMKADEPHGDWFARHFETQVGRLSDGQLWTLLLWTLAEFGRRRDDGAGLLPTDSGGRQCALYRTIPF